VSIASRLAGPPRDIWRELFHPADTRGPSPSFAEELDFLRRRAWEGLYWQDEVEDILYAVRDDEPLAEVAPDSGRLVSRYFELRRELRRVRSPELQPYVVALSEIFDYLGQLLHHAVALLGSSWRSELLREQQRRVGPVGPQAERLRNLVAELDRLAAG
jgi:hypothetical protein